MRIIAGQYRRRQIAFPKHIRPTQDKIRQAVFDCLGGFVEGSRVLDLFAGSGAFGLEALSRGARSVWFIDKDRRCSHLIHQNLSKLNVDKNENVEVYNFTQDATRAVKILARQHQVFDVIFLDPPYFQNKAKKALKTVAESDIVHPRSFVIVEHSRKEDLGCPLEGLELVKELSHGNIKVSFFAIDH